MDNITSVKKSCSILNLVVTPEQLRAMLGHKNLMVVDTRSYASYSQSHIPGAVNIDLMQFHWIDTSSEGISQFNRQTRILLSNIGVTLNKRVVFYDDVSGPSAARGVWLLLYFSHDKVTMLDGGINAWKTMGFKTETRANPFVHSNFRGKANPRILADLRRLRSSMKSGKAVIVDARSSEEYSGSALRAARGGHIPDSINIDWNENIEQDNFKSDQELERLYREIPKDAEVITYCQGGYRAANSFVVLKKLGYKKVKMYLGSWGEWGNRLDLPISRR